MLQCKTMDVIDCNRSCSSDAVEQSFAHASLIIKSSTNVTIPVDAIVMAEVDDALPIVPPSLMRMSSTKVTIPVEAMVMALVDEAEPIVPASAINIALDVRLVIPVTTPASMLTAPSNTIAEPLAGVMFTAPVDAVIVLPFMFMLSTSRASMSQQR